MESEVKLRVAGPEAARASLVHLGASLVAPRYFEDNWILDDATGSLMSGGKLLRLRRTPHETVVTYKGPRRVSRGVKSREEVETSVADPDAFEAILGGVGFRPVFRYQKYREVYHWKDVEIVIDETPIGTFFEIEGEHDPIHAAASALGFGPQDYISDSYATLFFAAGGKGDMVFP